MTVSCYARTLDPGRSYVFAVGRVRIPVHVPLHAHGMYQSITVSGQSVRFWVGEPSQCGTGISPAVAGFSIAAAVVIAAVILLLLRRSRNRPCDHPVHRHG